MATALIPEVLSNGGTEVARTVTLKVVLSPLRAADGHLRVQEQDVASGQTVATSLPADEGWIRVIWNGKVLSPEEQATQLLAPGDEVLAFPSWGLTGGIVESLIIYAVIGIAISLATTALSYVLFPPAKPHIQAALDEPTFSFAGIQTAIGPGQVVPVIYGRHRVGGQLLSASVDHALTVLDGPTPAPDPSRTRQIMSVGGGTQNEAISLLVPGHGWSDGDHVDVSGVTGKTGANGGWYIGIEDADIIFLKFTTNTDWNTWTGGGTVTNVPLGQGIRRVDAIATPPTLSMLLAIGEGPIAGILLDTLEINGQPVGNFPSVQFFTRMGTPDQSAIPEFGETANTFADGREISGLPGITYTTTQSVQAFVLNVVFQEGLYVMSERGEKQENISTIGYEYRIHPSGAWSGFSYFDVAAARTSTVRFAIRKEGLGLAQYDIHLAWSHARDVNDLRAKWVPTLESITEIQHNTNAYPNTALLGLRSVATDSLQGALPNMTVEVLGRIIRVNEFNPTLNWSDNAAPCVMDMLTNSRYGLGYPDSSIDLQAFIAWWFYNEQIIDGERRHTFNYVLDREQRGQPVLLEMCGAARTLLLKSEGLWTPRVTRDDNAVQLFSWANVTNLKLTYTRDADRINVMEGRFANETEGFEQDVLTWPTIENWPVEVRKASLDLRGITKPSRVMRALQFELNRRRLETLSLEMDCATDAVALQVHDIFRFAHPLPGWGVSGRLMPGSSTTTLFLDEPVTTTTGKIYHVYVRHSDDTVEIRRVSFPGVGQFTVLGLVTPLVGTPTPYTSLWAFGEETPVDTAVKFFRVVRMQRNSDTTVHIQAIAHNPSIYDEPTASPLPFISSLFNPLGPPPPLSSLVLTQVARIQPSGDSLLVVNLAWDVQPLSAGFGPYGGATILRRMVLDSSSSGLATAGTTELGTIQDASDSNVNFATIMQLRGHILEWDDYTVVNGATYVYRVVPVSQRGVPNNPGAREGRIHVGGATTDQFFPGTVANLRLKGQAVGATIWEGRDVHIEWDPIADNTLFTTTFFVQDYIVDVWAPGQTYLLRRSVVPSRGIGQSVDFSYTFEQNSEDQVRAGQSGARRDLAFYVWARTNTNRTSLQPASITVVNPAPDMSDMAPVVTPLVGQALIAWDQFVEPRDFDHYEVHLDTVNPPVAIYTEITTGVFSGVGASFRKIAPVNLIIGTTYYTYILPYDTFGPGLPSQTVSFVPVSADLSTLDSTPPDIPTGLVLTTGTDISDDGTIMPWIRAAWNFGPESDIAGYEIHFRVVPSLTPSVFQLGRVNNTRLQNVPGNTTVAVRIAAFDRIHNISGFTPEVEITTAADTVAPGPPQTLLAQGHTQGIHLLWTPPGDADYLEGEVWASTTNDRANANVIGRGDWSFDHTTLEPDAERWYWVRSFDTSGNPSATFFPASPTAGVHGQAGLLQGTYIENLTANKITTGTLQAVYTLGVGSGISLDGPNHLITVFDSQASPIPRVYLGKLGTLSNAYGMQIFNDLGQLMWNFTDGAQTLGIAERAIVGGKISVGALQAEHLSASTLFITNVAQMGAAVIGFAQIQNAAITTAHIQDAAIVTAKIQDLTVNTLKITGGAVTTPKIGTNAVTESLAVTSVGATIVAGTETVVATITFPLLEAGDQVWLVATGAVGIGAGDVTATIRLREDFGSGPFLGESVFTGPGQVSIPVQAVHLVPAIISLKTYVLTLLGTGGSVAITRVYFTGLRRQR